MSPWNMKNSVRKLEAFGCKNTILAERGTFFGYNMLVNDFTSLFTINNVGDLDLMEKKFRKKKQRKLLSLILRE